MPLTSIIEPASKPIDVIEARAHVRQDVTADDALLDTYIRAARRFAQEYCHRTLVATRYKLVLDSFPGPTLMGVPPGVPYSLPGHAVLLENGPVLAVQSIKYIDMSGAQQTLSPAVYTVDMTDLPGRITPRFGQIWPPVLPQIGSVEIVYDAGDAAAITASGSTLTIKGGLWKTLAIGDAVRFSNSGGALPAPLQLDTDYYVQSLPTATSLTVAATAGGAAITLTDAGSGTSFIGAIHESVRSWMLMRIGGLFENREDEVVLQRGTIVAVSYVDRLLDGAACWLN